MWVVVALAALAFAIYRIETDETHTHRTQIEGGPPAVCLLEVIRGAEPLLASDPQLERSLQEYVRLQEGRYRKVRCPVYVPLRP